MDKRIDEMIAAVAAVQYGTFARRQVREVNRKALQRRPTSGVIMPMSANVFRLAGAPKTDEQRIMAATLDVPGGAVASHFTAAWLWRFPGFPLRGVEVTARRAQHR